jgi:hypothetical protein
MRYLPIFAGVVLATVFSLSVLTDGGDVARAAWTTGNELLGMFGGFGLIALPAIFLASAFARRGVPRICYRIRVVPKGIDLYLERGKKVHLANARIRSGFVDDLPDGRARVSLELAGGVTDGDRVVVETDRETADSIAASIGPAPRFDLAAESWAWGAGLSAASVLAGAGIGTFAFERVREAIERAGAFQPQGAGFSVGMTVAAIGLVRVALAAVMSGQEVTVGIDGLRIEGALRKRFIAFESIDSVALETFGLTLVLVDGTKLRLGGPGVDADRLATLANMIEARRAETGPATPRVAAVLQEGEVHKWREAIEESTRGSGYRVGSVSSEALSDALSAPGLSSQERVATAIALLARGEEPSRIRVAAAGVANDSTRAALERLAEGEADDAALEALLVKRA